MSHWNHRLVKQNLDDGTEWFSIRETFYNDDGSILAYAETPSDLCGGTPEDIRVYIKLCQQAFNAPILIDGEVDFVDPDKEFCDKLEKLTDDQLDDIEDMTDDELDAYLREIENG